MEASQGARWEGKDLTNSPGLVWGKSVLDRSLHDHGWVVNVDLFGMISMALCASATALPTVDLKRLDILSTEKSVSISMASQREHAGAGWIVPDPCRHQCEVSYLDVVLVGHTWQMSSRSWDSGFSRDEEGRCLTGRR